MNLINRFSSGSVGNLYIQRRNVSSALTFPPKLDLATRLATPANGPEMILKSIFKETIGKFETKTNTKLPIIIKQKVWKEISKTKLKTIQAELIIKVYEKVLVNFKEYEIEIMLFEHKLTGAIQNESYKKRLMEAYWQQHSFLKNVVYQKAEDLSKFWTVEVNNAIRKELDKNPFNKI